MTTLRKGSQGDDVKILQQALSSYGIAADGIFGVKTEQAVKKYQTTKKLVVDGLAGTNTCKSLGILDAIEKAQNGSSSTTDCTISCEDLKQYASPHGSMTYGPDSSYSTYKSGGCGVTSFAVVQRAYGLCDSSETSTQTIQRLGKYAWQHGYRIKGAGTTCGLFKTNGTTYVCTRKADDIKNALLAGKLVILLIKKGFPNGYTGSGHYIVAYGIKNGYVLLRDVGSALASRQKASLSSITSGLKYAYIMSKS